MEYRDLVVFVAFTFVGKNYLQVSEDERKVINEFVAKGLLDLGTVFSGICRVGRGPNLRDIYKL